MKSTETGGESEALQHTAQIVSAYLQGNAVEMDEITGLIDIVHSKVTQLVNAGAGTGLSSVPAVPVEESITPEFIICLEDGKAFKMLKKHLKTKYNLTPEEYRSKWGLPADYPMVAPNYAMKRQALAKASGLGRNR